MYYLETGSCDACLNLAIEQYILENKTQGDWLMLWQNANTVVVGRNQNTLEEINLSFVQTHDIRVVRRITGGGAVYHDMGNLNYSFITDLGDAETLSISRFTEPVCRALGALGVRAETSGRNDIIVDGKKVSGVAQRIYKSRILHHGTLLYDPDAYMLSGALNADPAKFSSKSAKSVRSRVGRLKDYLPAEVGLSQLWQRLVTELAGEGLARVCLDGAELAQAEKLAEEKYRSWDWTYGYSPEYAYKNRLRFPGGTLETRMTVKNGNIERLSFFGDYMAAEENAPLLAALTGARYDRETVAGILESFALNRIFGTISAEEILKTMFG